MFYTFILPFLFLFQLGCCLIYGLSFYSLVGCVERCNERNSMGYLIANFVTE